MIKKTLLFLIIYLLFSPVILNSQQCAVFYDDFESNSILSHWTGATNSFYTTNIDIASGTYSLETNMNSAFPLTLYDGMETYFTPSQPSFISYWIKTSNTNTTGAATIIIGDSNTYSGGNTGMYFVNYFSGNLRIIGNTTYSHPALNNTWYFVEYKNIDWFSQSSDLYINGQLIASNFGFRNYFASVSKIILSNGTFNASGTTYSAWDDILIGGSISTTYVNDTICSGTDYTFPDGTTQQSINSSITDTSIVTASNFCDSIIITSLTVNQVDTSVSQNGIVLTANSSIANFIQWVDCDNNFNLLPNQNNSSFTATSNGNYAVIISENNCIDTSSCYLVNTVGTHFISSNNLILFPNPSKDLINIRFVKSYQNINLTINDINGRLISSIEKYDCDFITIELNEAPGIYFLNINTDGSNQRHKFVIH